MEKKYRISKQGNKMASDSIHSERAQRDTWIIALVKVKYPFNVSQRLAGLPAQYKYRFNANMLGESNFSLEKSAQRVLVDS